MTDTEEKCLRAKKIVIGSFKIHQKKNRKTKKNELRISRRDGKKKYIVIKCTPTEDRCNDSDIRSDSFTTTVHTIDDSSET